MILYLIYFIKILYVSFKMKYVNNHAKIRGNAGIQILNLTWIILNYDNGN